MKIGIAKEIIGGETRVACVPEQVGRLRELGHRVLVERAAGAGAGFADAEYQPCCEFVPGTFPMAMPKGNQWLAQVCSVCGSKRHRKYSCYFRSITIQL